MSEQKNNTPVIRISMQMAIHEKRGLSFETYVGADQPVEFINATIDKLCSAADRKIAYYELETLEQQFENETNVLKALEENFQLIGTQQAVRNQVNGKSIAAKPSAAEFKAKTDAETNIKNRREYLKRLQKEIAKRRALSEGGNLGNTSSAANS